MVAGAGQRVTRELRAAMLPGGPGRRTEFHPHALVAVAAEEIDPAHDAAWPEMAMQSGTACYALSFMLSTSPVLDGP